jgi:PAS domain S-box-containing protein
MAHDIRKCLDCAWFQQIKTPEMLEDLLRKLSGGYSIAIEAAVKKEAEQKRRCDAMAAELSEVCDALQKIASGDPFVRISEASDIEVLARLEKQVNLTAQNLLEIVDLSHEFAIGLAEHFDVLSRVAGGDLSARVSGASSVELLESLKVVTNQMIENISLIMEKRRHSEEKYRALVENMQDGVFILQGRKYRFVNESLARMHGYTVEEMLEMDSLSLVVPEHRELVTDHYRKLVAREPVEREYEFDVLHKDDGTRRTINLSMSVFTFQGKIAALGTVKDITERKNAEAERQKLEHQLYQAQKMEAVGTLAGGIAHDFNNLLMGILGNATLARMHMDSSHPGYERLKNIETYVQSGAELTRQLLGFARGGKFEVKPTNPNELIRQTSEMFGRTKKELTLFPNLQNDIWMIDVDRSQIEQVLMNMYVNAWQAMPGGGSLYLQTENVILDSSFTTVFSVIPGKYVKISITDTGVGMDANVQKRIFEPFFTTKEKGRGTGLGLASAYGIIKNHGGFINVYSEKGRGATFTVYIPASDQKAGNDSAPALPQIQKGSGTIMLVDDEKLILDIGVQLLESLGYQVITASNGKQAIEIYDRCRQRIVLVILDMIMPVMGGSETYDRLKAAHPDVRVLLSSGYSMDGQAADILKRGCNGFIQKPFNIEQLSRKISDILQTHPMNSDSPL